MQEVCPCVQAAIQENSKFAIYFNKSYQIGLILSIWRQHYNSQEISMRAVTFISHKQTLKQSLAEITPKFDTFLTLIPKEVRKKMSPIDLAFCDNSFVFPNDATYDLILEQPPKTLQGLLQQTVRQLLSRNKKTYIQCLGQQYKDFHLIMKNLNFGRTIIETSPAFKSLFSILPHNHFYQILLNYMIIIPYKGQYIQVAGKALNQKYNMKAVGGMDRGKAKTLPPAPQIQIQQEMVTTQLITTQNIAQTQLIQTQTQAKAQTQTQHSTKTNQATPSKLIGPQGSILKANAKSYSYNIEHIHRMQIFYCSTFNRLPGLFAKNIFFDMGQRKSIYINQTGHLIRTCLQQHFKKKLNIPKHRLDRIQSVLPKFFQSVRDMFYFHERQGKKISKFSLLLSKYCPLPSDYKALRQRVYSFVYPKEERVQDGKKLFDDLYQAASSYREVVGLIQQCLRRTIPDELLGKGNKQILIEMMGDFISMKRFQNYKMQDFLSRMDVFELTWLQFNYNKKYHRKIVTNYRKYLSLLLAFLVNQYIVHIIKLNFYVTQKHKQANRIFYYRKPLWTLISKVALKKFSQENLEPISGQSVLKIKKNLQVTVPEGKLRILPKKGTFRPIITFNRKVQFINDNNSQKQKATLNQILADTQLVLRNLKNILGQKFGYCIFDNRQIMRKYDSFVERWRRMGSPPLKYFTLDIKKCYDSIDTSLLLKFIQQTNYIEDLYLIIKYNRLYRNKKPLFGQNGFTNYFNYKQRATAVGMSQDPIEIKEEHKIPAINIFPAKQKLITKENIIKKLKCICEGSIVSYRKNFWLQKLGIPQGLNVSGVLCSLYFAYLQQQYVKVKTGLLMRLTDDYFYIGPEQQAVQVLNSLLRCASMNNFSFSQDKISKNFEHPILKKMNTQTEIVWIGKKINVQTLEVIPNFEMSQKVSYAMNVNINKGNIKSFLKNKLKSLLTNHFASYFKPKLFPFSSLAKVVRLYTEISLQKFLPFIIKVIQTVEQPQPLLLKVFKSSIHEFLLFACTLAGCNKDSNSQFYRKLYVQVGEQLCAFFGRRLTSQRTFINLRKIFQNDHKEMRRQLQKMEIQ